MLSGMSGCSHYYGAIFFAGMGSVWAFAGKILGTVPLSALALNI